MSDLPMSGADFKEMPKSQPSRQHRSLHCLKNSKSAQQFTPRRNLNICNKGAPILALSSRSVTKPVSLGGLESPYFEIRG